MKGCFSRGSVSIVNMWPLNVWPFKEKAVSGTADESYKGVFSYGSVSPVWVCMKSKMCDHSNESYKGRWYCFKFFSPWLKILRVWLFKWKLQSLFSYGSVLIVNVLPLNVWPFKEKAVMVLRMKATKAYFPMVLFHAFESVYEILNVWSFKWKLQRRIFLCYKLIRSSKKHVRASG